MNSPALRRLALVVLSLGLAAAALAHEITVYSYVTPDGRRLSAPTPDRPVWCALGNGGDQTLGDMPRGERSPPMETVCRLVHDALAAQYYPSTGPGSPPADLLLVFHWGYLSPDFVGLKAEQPLTSLNAAQRLALVGGRALRNANTRSEYDAILQDAADERYFVIVSAYDYATYAAKHTQQLLWRTQMSVPRAGLTADQAMPLLVASGAALFGHETPLPRRIELNVTGQLRPEFASPPVARASTTQP